MPALLHWPKITRAVLDAVGQDTKAKAQSRGRWAEWMCLCILRLKGWRVLAHNLRATRGTGAGEVDLIARRGSVLAFIEVKARGDTAQGLAAVSETQRHRIARGAEAFLARHSELTPCTVRFDVMVVTPWRWPTHIEDAWRPDG